MPSKLPDSSERQQQVINYNKHLFVNVHSRPYFLVLAAPYYFMSPVMASMAGKRGNEIKKKTQSLFIRIVLLTVYLTSGAAIFSAIENDGSINEKQVEINLKVHEIKQNMTRRFNASEHIIEQYVKDLRELFKKHHGCGKYSHNNWSYYQSLYFAGSVTTTIGKWNFVFAEGVCTH